MSQDQEKYIKDLQAEIVERDKDMKALREELTVPNQDTSAASVIKKTLQPFVPEWLSNLQDLALCADSESVRMNCNKLLIEWATTNKLSSSDTETDNDLKQLLSAITKSKSKAKT